MTGGYFFPLGQWNENVPYATGKGVTKWKLGLWILLTFPQTKIWNARQTQQGWQKKKEQSFTGSPVPRGKWWPQSAANALLLHPHPPQNVQPFWTSHVSFRDMRREERKREKAADMLKRQGGRIFFPLTDVKRKIGTISCDCLQPFQNIKSVYRNVLRKKLHMFSLLSETLSLCSNKELVGLFPSYKNTASTELPSKRGSEPPTHLLQERPISTGNHTTAISHWSWEVSPSKQKRTTLHKAKPQLIERIHCSFGDPLPPHPNLTEKPRPIKSKGPAQTRPQELELASSFLQK